MVGLQDEDAVLLALLAVLGMVDSKVEHSFLDPVGDAAGALWAARIRIARSVMRRIVSRSLAARAFSARRSGTARRIRRARISKS